MNHPKERVAFINMYMYSCVCMYISFLCLLTKYMTEIGISVLNMKGLYL